VSTAAERQAEYDAKDYRRSLYTNTKDDHPADWLTGEPCRCEHGDDHAWVRAGNAMKVLWPPQPETRTPAPHTPARRKGRSR
jgi:hypothetical protein